ncbi:MAG: hypothetical protein M0Z51_03865 [Propionibacterium sp.]|nr:hypothetical protein [Propionibacterium sp.]
MPGSSVLAEPVDPQSGALPGDAGHGTFIPGLIRQVCPQARILAIPVVSDAGVVSEPRFISTLQWLLARQSRALRVGDAGELIDPSARSPASVRPGRAVLLAG